MHFLIPPNIEVGRLELNIIAKKNQDKDNLILNNALRDLKRNQITNIKKERDHTIM